MMPMMPHDPRYHGNATLALADGRVFRGMAFGARATVVGEVVFNTSMTGYQEILTDPSYRGQMVCLTAVEIGNCGVNPEDEESAGPGAEALIVRSLSPIASNWRSSQTLPAYLAERNIPAIAEIDTRALTRHLREVGAVVGALSTEHGDAEKLIELARRAPPMEGRALAREVSTKKPYAWTEPTWGNGREIGESGHVVVYDYGVKRNILRNLRDEGLRVTVVPADTPVADVVGLKPDGVLLSNGPGDPAALPEVTERIRELLESQPELPVFGICLGHQLLCLALGGRTYKLKFGHHGGNHPVRDERNERVEITAQNHGFAADMESLGDGGSLTHLNLFDATVAGLRMRDRPVRGVQYHPEAAPGPHDASHLFAEFADEVRRRRPAEREA